MAFQMFPGAPVPAARALLRKSPLCLFLSILLTLCGFYLLREPLLLKRFVLLTKSTNVTAPESSTIGEHVDDSPAGMTPGARGYRSGYSAFQKCLLKPPLGSDRGQEGDNQTAQRRDTVREVTHTHTHTHILWGPHFTVCTFLSICLFVNLFFFFPPIKSDFLLKCDRFRQNIV